jgi:uncharacterized protein YceH (UPF0502 family)
MSSELQSETTAPPTWPELSLVERRVLGVLVEKAKTTPDVYPLSINALVTGCNQKSNRDPLMELADFEVEDALVSAQKKGLAIKITGGRVIRWRHSLYEAWHVDKVELAVLAELLLRGPQTEGELRGRASRMEPIDDLDALRNVLRRLAERGLVVYLTPEGRRGTILTHGLHAPDELERLRVKSQAEAVEAPVPATAPPRTSTPPAGDRGSSALETRLTEACGEIASLRAVVAELQATVAGLSEQVRALQGSEKSAT